MYKQHNAYSWNVFVGIAHQLNWAYACCIRMTARYACTAWPCAPVSLINDQEVPSDLAKNVRVLQHEFIGSDESLELELSVAAPAVDKLKFTDDLSGLGVTHIDDCVHVWDPLAELTNPVGYC